MEEVRIAKYNAAVETHKHCDTISMALVAGMLAVSGSSLAVFNAMRTSDFSCYAPYAYLLTAVVVTILFCMYRRSSDHARVARNVARCLEYEDGPGVSYVLYGMYGDDELERKNLWNQYGPRKDKWWKLEGIRKNVFLLWFVLIATMILLFCLARWK